MSFTQSKDTVCKYYLQGQCRFGTSCRFAHPAGQGPATNSGTGSFRNQTWSAKDARATSFDAESIIKDLTQGQERPLYPLSSYGPGKCVPCIIDGLDQSPEELRVAAWAAVRDGGSLDVYKAHEKQLIDAAQALISAALATGPITLDEAKRVWNAVDERGIPTTTGAAEAKSRLRDRLQPSSKPTFGSTAATSTFGTTSAFGSSQPSQPSAFGGTSFVKPGTGAFGSSAGTGTFGNTSTFGNNSFGSGSQPSAFGVSTQAPQTSAFGSNASATPAFGQSRFGSKPAFGQSGFGATPASTTSAFGTSNSTTAPAFGQSGFGASANAAPAFGQSGFGAKPTTSAFGTSATGGGFGAFSGKSTSFGGTTSTSNTASAFGAPTTGTSSFGGTTGAPAFGASAGTGGGFGAFANKSTSFGGQPGSGSAFGSTPTATGSAFGQLTPITTTTTATTDAGMEADTPTTSAPPSVFGQTQPNTTSVFGQTQPATSSFGQSQTSAPSAFGQGSAFGAGASAFGASKPSAFGTPTPAATSAFGTSASTASTSGAPGTTSAFGVSTTSSAFGAPAKPSAFGGASAFGSSSAPSAFSKPTMAPANPFGPKSAKDRDPYADLLPPDYAATLSEGIMNAFKADKFELGSIPECVPPFEVR